MKVAVCYSGLVRNFFDTIYSHKKYLLDLYECDVFFHFWDVVGKTHVGFPKMISGEQTDTIDNEIKNKINLLLSPTVGEFESFKNKDEELNLITNRFSLSVEHFNPRHVVGMYYSINNVHKKLVMYQNINNIMYDVVIRIRSDILFTDEVRLDKPEENVLVTPQVHNYPINDQFGYGDIRTMNVYANLYDKICNINPIGFDLHPENALRNHLQENNIRIKTDASIKYELVRTQSDGTLTFA